MPAKKFGKYCNIVNESPTTVESAVSKLLSFDTADSTVVGDSFKMSYQNHYCVCQVQSI